MGEKKERRVRGREGEREEREWEGRKGKI